MYKAETETEHERQRVPEHRPDSDRERPFQPEQSPTPKEQGFGDDHFGRTVYPDKPWPRVGT